MLQKYAYRERHATANRASFEKTEAEALPLERRTDNRYIEPNIYQNHTETNTQKTNKIME